MSIFSILKDPNFGHFLLHRYKYSDNSTLDLAYGLRLYFMYLFLSSKQSKTHRYRRRNALTPAFLALQFSSLFDVLDFKQGKTHRLTPINGVPVFLSLPFQALWKYYEIYPLTDAPLKAVSNRPCVLKPHGRSSGKRRSLIATGNAPDGSFE